MRSLAQIENAAEQYRATLQRQDARHVTILPDKTIFHRLDGKDLIYVPTATGALFHRDNSFIRLIMGPFGSGKTTCAINEIVRRACAMPVWKSGRRASRWIIIRNTSGELYSTTLQSWLAWCGDLGDIKKRQKPLLTYEHVFNDGHGLIELEMIFLALDRPEDVRKLKSFEATGAYMNELSEIPEIVLSHLPGRLNGRYPSNKFCPEPYWSGIVADTNPPDEDHYIYKKFETTPTESYKIFHQPPGLLFENGVLIKDQLGRYIQNPECDNYQNMNADYYVKLAENQREGFIKVFCCGKYGVVESGKRVYPEYNDDLHSMPKLEAIQGLPIHLGWDFGLTPACVVFQISPRGQMRVLKEYQAEDMGIRTFAKNIVIPSLPIDFPYNKVGESEGDPAGEAGDVIMEELSCIGELNNLGIRTNAASSNDIDVRVGSVRYFLNMMIDGQPAFVLDREKCPGLRKGFVSGYHFKRMNVSGDDRYQEKPNKNKYSHCFVGDTLVMTNSGEKAISKIALGDKVLTSSGYKKVTALMNSVSMQLIELSFNNGSVLRCTPDHPFITDHGIVRADELQYAHILYSMQENKSWEEGQNTLSKNLTAFGITEKVAATIRPIIIFTKPLVICIEMFGNLIMGLFRPNIISITSTTTELTMSYPTFVSLLHQSTQSCTVKKEKDLKKLRSIWHFLGLWQHCGINQRKEESGIQNMEKTPGKIGNIFRYFASIAKKCLIAKKALIKKAFAQLHVNQRIEESKKWMTKKETVLSVSMPSNVTDILRRKPALRLVQAKLLQTQKKVYDLTVQGEHCFYANGILVSNCHDALQYGAMKFASDRIIEKQQPKEVVNMYNPVMRLF